MSQRYWFFLRLIAPLLVALSIWIPEFSRFRVDHSEQRVAFLSESVDAKFTKRLLQAAQQNLVVNLGIPQADRERAARSLLAGVLASPQYLTEPYRIQGWPSDLKYGPPTFRLAMASLAVEDLLLKEYVASGELAYYHLARDRILSFAKWEREQKENVEYLWNDHAISARISVLIRLWAQLRNDAEIDPESRKAFLALIDRSGQLLAKSQLFTVRTNHGVMQNLALLQITAAFPTLPAAQEWRKLAVERLDLQLSFYVSDEGVVLEHSAGYHELGVELLAAAIELMRSNDLEPSQRIVQAHQKADQFLRLIKRPDGSLPVFGNTGAHAAGEFAKPELPATHSSEFALYPLSGYSVWWSLGDSASQTLVVWAKHEGHGHKHADEPSLHFWSRGIDWITATGYWPYGARGFEQANGWLGSNAPHARDELEGSPRNVNLLASGESGPVRVLDVQNARASGLVLRRQVIQLSTDQLLVIDGASDGATGNSRETETLWTFDRRLQLQRNSDQSYRAHHPKMALSMSVDVGVDSAAPSLNTSVLRGSWDPFGGWVAAPNPEPAPGLRVLREAGSSVTATLFSIENENQVRELKLSPGIDPEHWRLDIKEASGDWHVSREGREVVLIGRQDGPVRVELKSPASVEARQNSLRSALDQAVDAYPPWRPLNQYHPRLYLGIFVLWAVFELAGRLLPGRPASKAWSLPFSAFVWLGAYVWIHGIYLK